MARRARQGTWVVIEHEDGTFEVQRNRRPLASGLSGRGVQRMLRARTGPDDKILREEPDGYRVPVRLSDFANHLGK